MINFSDQSLWQTNGAAGWISDGVARVTSTVPDTGTGTLILKEQISAALPWEATFTYTMADTTSGVPADGFSCFIHNDPSRGAGAIGGGAQGFAVAGIGTAFGFVLNIYFDPNPGPFYRFAWVENGVSLYDTRADDLNGVMPENGIPVNVRLTHDGAGLVTVTLTQNGNTYTDSRWFDIPAELNGAMGWFGFGGGIGGCNADQQISEMALTTPLPSTTHLTDAALWTFTGSAQDFGDGVFQLTTSSGGHSAIYLRDKIDLNVPWRFSFLYHATPANGCADGFAVFAHNDPRGTAALGDSGGGRGYTGITPQAGLTGNIHGDNFFNWIINGGENGDRAYNPNTITPRNGNLRVIMEYDGTGLLRFILRQGNNVWVTTRAIDLADAFGSPDAWLGISAACGGETADQRVSEVSFIYWSPEYLYPAYATSVTVKPSPTDSALYGSYLPPDVDAGILTLYHGAALDILPNPRLATDTPYSVTFQSVVLHGAATVAMHNNGTGAGTLTFAHLHAEPGGSVALTGNVILPDNTLTVTVSPNMPRGLHLLADFTSAAGVDDTTTFILDPTDAPPRAKLIFRNGRLYLNTAQGTVLILR
ncbi:MAG: hypothetical protein FWG50_10060 [Kiritimatiellaeota bacterium]|nr:hypothetical protein [Kiritimatiellota bacterium]